jgi:hypothetical protein
LWQGRVDEVRIARAKGGTIRPDLSRPIVVRGLILVATAAMGFFAAFALAMTTAGGSAAGSRATSIAVVTPQAITFVRMPRAGRLPGLVDTLNRVTPNQTSVDAASTATFTVTLAGIAPAGGAVVALSSSDPLAATAPDSVVVRRGSSTTTFDVTTSAVHGTTKVMLTARYRGTHRSATLTVKAAPKLPPRITTRDETTYATTTPGR